MRKKPLFILTILFLSSIIRLFNLGKMPAGLSLTEAKFGLAVSVLGNWVLNPIIIRLPFALLGILSIYIFYLLVKKLFKNEMVALVSGFLLAITPWHIQESRIFSWGLVLFTILILVAYLFIDKIVGNINNFFKCSLLVSVILFVIAFITPLNGVAERVNAERGAVAKSFPSVGAKVFINKYLENYRERNKILFENFDFGNLFFSGHPRERWGIEDEQKLLLFLLPFILIGIFKIGRTQGKFIFSLWLTSLSFLYLFSFRQSQTLILIIPYIILASLGILGVLKKRRLAIKIIVFIIFIFGFYEMVFWGTHYCLGLNESLFSPRREIYEELANKVGNILKPGEKVLVSTRLVDPEPFFNFYLKENTINYEFRDFKYWSESKDNRLFIDVRSDDPSPTEPLYSIGEEWPGTIEVLAEFEDQGKRQKVVIYRIK
jgi:hypothetical protein